MTSKGVIKLKFLKRESLIICFDTESQYLLLKKNVKHVFIKSNIDDDKNILQQIFNKYNSINYKKILKVFNNSTKPYEIGTIIKSNNNNKIILNEKVNWKY